MGAEWPIGNIHLNANFHIPKCVCVCTHIHLVTQKGLWSPRRPHRCVAQARKCLSLRVLEYTHRHTQTLARI